MTIASKRTIHRTIAGAVGLAAACQLTAAVPAGASPTTSNTSSATGGSRSVIVILRDQLHSLPVTPAHVAARRTQAREAQNDVIAGLSGRAVRNVHHYTTVNAVSMKVTAAQAAALAALAADPAVALVADDTKVAMPSRPEASAKGSATPHVATPAPGACPSTPSKPLLEPEALTDTHTRSSDPTARTAQKFVNGAGVKVGYIADAINPNNPDFIRRDGTHVITDYKAFSADGPTPEEGGAEAFGDASSIAAQGRISYDLSTFVNPAYALPAGCNIRIYGMAPGASIVALKTDFYTSSIIQAIDYAVSTDKVDVLNESFGLNAIPDSTSKAAIQYFNDAAVDAGTTVTVSSGDAGTTGTIGSPAADPKIISVAASTNSRGYAQTGYAAFAFSNGTWVNREISSLSSGGFTQGGGTVDLAAPGESGWAVCDAESPDCTNYQGGSSGFQLFGGTSQSAPLTAGAAALVIQAYRKSHGGDSPTPAQVKSFLTSTATDLGLPPFEQGSGLLNSYAAVSAAMTYLPKSTPPASLNGNIYLPKTQYQVSGAPGSTHTVTVGVRNASSKSQTVAATARDFATVASNTTTTALNASSDPTYPYPTTGAPWAYKKVQFTVPSGIDRLVGRMFWNGGARLVNGAVVTPVVRLTLLDPSGRYVANSRPQGGAVSANYANLDVRAPAAGTWTAIEYTLASANGYTGDVTLQTTSQLMKKVGTVSPATQTIPANGFARVTATVTIPDTGDNSQAIVLTTSAGHKVAVPVIERAVVPTASGSGSFAGTITGGNARAGAPAGTLTYAFDVPSGKKDLDVGVKLASNPRYQLEGVLVDPNDEAQAVDTNYYTASDGQTVVPKLGMQLTTAAPIPGRWRLVIYVINPVPGTQLTENFTGTVAFDKVRAVAVGLPTSTSTTLAQGRTKSAIVTVHNTGVAPINVQIDPRTDAVAPTPLTSPFGSQAVDLPGPSEVDFLVPPDTTGLTATSSTSIPAVMELLPVTQGIDSVGDLKSAQDGSTISTATDAHDTGTVASGYWYSVVDNVGAFGPAGAPTGHGSINLSATTRGFDKDVTSSTGDFWAVTTDPAADTGRPVTIQPGGTAKITVAITPSAPIGTTVSGLLNVYTTPSLAHATYVTTGDVLAKIPYSYTVGS